MTPTVKVLAIALGLLPWLTNTLRLYIWARFLGHHLRLRDCFQMTLAVDLGSAISPTAVGGGFFKWGMLVQRGVSPGSAASLNWAGLSSSFISSKTGAAGRNPAGSRRSRTSRAACVATPSLNSGLVPDDGHKKARESGLFFA